MHSWPVGWGVSIWLLFGAQMPLCYTALQNQLKCTACDSLCVVISVLWALF